MNSEITVASLNEMNTNDVIHSDIDLTTYIVRTADGFAVCDNGEEVTVTTAAAALQILVENAEQNS